MYNGEDIAGLASHLTLGRLDAVWGSRRLSVRDIHESYRLKFRHQRCSARSAIAGSHALSLLYLALYGRYVSDTLSAARVVRAADALTLAVPLNDKLVNQHLLSGCSAGGPRCSRVPVQFFAMAPDQVEADDGPLDGLAGGRTRGEGAGAPLQPSAIACSWFRLPGPGRRGSSWPSRRRRSSQVAGRPMIDHLLALLSTPLAARACSSCIRRAEMLEVQSRASAPARPRRPAAADRHARRDHAGGADVAR